MMDWFSFERMSFANCWQTRQKSLEEVAELFDLPLVEEDFKDQIDRSFYQGKDMRVVEDKSHLAA